MFKTLKKNKKQKMHTSIEGAIRDSLTLLVSQLPAFYIERLMHLLHSLSFQRIMFCNFNHYTDDWVIEALKQLSAFSTLLLGTSPISHRPLCIKKLPPNYRNERQKCMILTKHSNDVRFVTHVCCVIKFFNFDDLKDFKKCNRVSINRYVQ